MRVTPVKTEIIIKATKPDDIVGDKGRRIIEITAVLRKR